LRTLGKRGLVGPVHQGRLAVQQGDQQALDRSDAVVVLRAAKPIESAQVRDEAAVGRDSGRLSPARIDDSLPPLGSRLYQTIDLAGPKGRAVSTGMRELPEPIAALAPIRSQ